MASAEAGTDNVRVLLARDVAGKRVEVADMKVVREPFSVPSALEAGAVVVKNLYFSLDPYMRGRMNTQVKSYFPSFTVGEVLETRSVAHVVAGEREGIKPGDTVVVSRAGWETYTLVSPDTPLVKVDPALTFSPSLFLGLLGLTGATAYHGLDILQAKAGETIFVSGAAGAVGIAVGQFAKVKGLKVLGSAGSDEKVRLLKENFGYDDAFNYKTASSGIEAALKKIAPDGIDLYFDNVGGEHLDAALASLKVHGRICACGMISQCNGESYAFKNFMAIIGKQLKMEGFIIMKQLFDKDWMARFQAEVGGWLAQKKIVDQETIVEGVDKAPEAFVGLFEGVNTGKLLIKV